MVMGDETVDQPHSCNLDHARSHTKDGSLALPEGQNNQAILTFFNLVALAVIIKGLRF